MRSIGSKPDACDLKQSLDTLKRSFNLSITMVWKFTYNCSSHIGNFVGCSSKVCGFTA